MSEQRTGVEHCNCASGQQRHKSPCPRHGKNVYQRFVEEVDALTIQGADPAVKVVGELTRAVKRAQMVVDGELATVAAREADDYVSEVMSGLVEARKRKESSS